MMTLSFISINNKNTKYRYLLFLILFILIIIFCLMKYNMKNKIICEEIEEEYKLTVYDRNSNIILEELYPVRPSINKIKNNLLEVVISVGSPARYVFFIDQEDSKKSEVYFNPILIKNKYIAFMDNGELILTDIFNENLFYYKIIRDFTKTADPMSAIISIDFLNHKTIEIHYFKGDDYMEIEEKIEINI